jgi:hypothetical protein
VNLRLSVLKTACLSLHTHFSHAKVETTTVRSYCLSSDCVQTHLVETVSYSVVNKQANKTCPETGFRYECHSLKHVLACCDSALCWHRLGHTSACSRHTWTSLITGTPLSQKSCGRSQTSTVSSSHPAGNSQHTDLAQGGLHKHHIQQKLSTPSSKMLQLDTGDVQWLGFVWCQTHCKDCHGSCCRCIDDSCSVAVLSVILDAILDLQLVSQPECLSCMIVISFAI